MTPGCAGLWAGDGKICSMGSTRGDSPNVTSTLLRALAGVFVAVLFLSAGGPAAANLIRKQIKEAKRDLIDFERDLSAVVKSFHRLEDELEAAEKAIRSEKRLLAGMQRGDSFEQAVASILLEPAARARLEAVTSQREILLDVIPQMRDYIWQKGLERKEMIETLDDAIALLESKRSGELVTNAGVNGGQLITYSADWAAVAMCESTNRWHINTGLFDGGLQFLPSTWWGFGGGEYARYAYQATRRQQIDIAERVLAVQGPNAWPNCFAALPADTDE